VIAGNLELDSALSLSGVGPGRVRLATLGEIHLSELDLSRLRNVAVEVVAGGDLTVDSLLTTDAAEVELLFHSARGAIRIGGLGADASWCIPGHAPTQVRIRFEAEAGADVGGVAVPAGCGFTRDERVWPVRQVLGELVM
jgi:hypothetical protein